MSEIAGQTGHITGGPAPRTTAADTVQESYSFACMRCGHGWEQSYEIEHHFDAQGAEFVTYVANGLVVPSPLSRPSCLNCDGHVVRIMRAGQVSSAQNRLHGPTPVRPRKTAEALAVPEQTSAREPERTGVPEAPRARHHWHLSDLLHPFHHRKAV
ncbi:hypothetical protein ACFYXC_11815 [Streptomyces sp. NPDC002701]|uniref:hypothetical protein n=1 Tax=Streptomyces sp. NPDC002701 TaxID=3364661 RepID=UPI00369098F9